MILPSLARTGPGIVAMDLCREYVKLGHKCKVFYFDDIVGLDMPCETERIKFRQPIDFDKWDIIHSHMFRPDAYIWYHKRKIKKAKTLTTLHNPITYKATRTGFNVPVSFFLSQIWNLCIKAQDWIVCLNKITQSELPQKIKSRSSVIFNGRNILTDSNNSSYKFKQIQSICSEYKIIGTISSITRRKGLSQAIRALPFLPDYALLIVGEGPERQILENLAKDLNVDQRVVFVGFQKNPTEYLPLMDVFIMCSESEGFPLALIESAAFGRPSVLSNIPILKSIISEQQGVRFYEINNIADLSQKIRDVYKQKDLLGCEIQNFYKDCLTSDIMAKNYIKLYEFLLGIKFEG